MSQEFLPDPGYYWWIPDNDSYEEQPVEVGYNFIWLLGMEEPVEDEFSVGGLFIPLNKENVRTLTVATIEGKQP